MKKIFVVLAGALLAPTMQAGQKAAKSKKAPVQGQKKVAPRPAQQKQAAAVVENQQATDLRRTLDRLWTDHVLWTRQYICAALLDLPEAKAVLARLLRNQKDIGDAIAMYYGSQAGSQLTKLLKDHIKIAGDIVKAAKNGDQKTMKQLDQVWHKNADDIARFLSEANPDNWMYDMMLAMLNDHLTLTTQEVKLRLGKKWKEDINNYDKILTQALDMAKGFSDGIIAQFPEQFR